MLLKVILAQLVVISLIIFVLKKIFDRQLIELAVHSVEALDAGRVDKNLTELTVVTYGDLSSINRQRIIDALRKKINKTVNVIATKDKGIKGGMIIKIQNQSFDYSLVGRLREGGFIK